MKIFGPGQAQPAQIRRSGRNADAPASTFASHLADESAGAGQSAAAPPLRAPNALLALQEIPDATHARKRAVRRGQNLLDRLESIRHGLLLGELPAEQLRRLAHELAAERPLVSEPGLLQVLDEIELRAHVELAKLGL